jgi:hypothetical protein
MCQFTPAPNPNYPQNLAELCFANMMLFFGFFVFSSFLGNAASRFTMMQTKAMQRSAERGTMRQYFSDHKIGKMTAQRVETYLAFSSAQGHRVLWKQVAAFQLLPKKYLLQLRYEAYVGPLTMHPLFACLDQGHHGMVVDICARATSEMAWRRGHELFSFGSKATGMLVVVAGSLKYNLGHQELISNEEWGIETIGPTSVHKRLGAARRRGTLPLEKQESMVTVAKHDCVCEGALWMEWTHKGSMLVVSDCTTMEVNAESLCDVALDHPMGIGVLRAYSRIWFRRRIEAISPTGKVGRAHEGHLEEQLSPKTCRSSPNLTSPTSATPNPASVIKFLSDINSDSFDDVCGMIQDAFISAGRAERVDMERYPSGPGTLRLHSPHGMGTSTMSRSPSFFSQFYWLMSKSQTRHFGGRV